MSLCTVVATSVAQREMCAAKLKDGLFLGDYETAHDLEFVAANKITRIINCAGREVGNAFERSGADSLPQVVFQFEHALSFVVCVRAGVQYLTYTWPESGNVIIFDDSNRYGSTAAGTATWGVIGRLLWLAGCLMKSLASSKRR
jgi:hypothetical protein